ncbi:hypothetical protein Sipo8835_32590 [Streptomyces ipomoeae]|uniref:Uncharacterized protein n=1 Tax=Streptomyces ipomoeae TaxID=103232 RepID=A0AAE8VZP0_9ACTN|nr:hypothetical protein [Streptomyces ipomoeae]TQE24853.1 hypothetical protein Sipo8835_32590 [Streptomyces ipomoeae]
MSTQPESTPTPAPRHLRLLPWSNDGKRAHLVTDGTRSFLSQLADTIEEQQIQTAAVIVSLARPMVEDTADLGKDELRWVARRLIESLTDVLNIAESRGQRLPGYTDEDDDAADDEPDGTD